jgi:hypothetical protein
VIQWLRNLRHRLAHKLGWTYGEVETWWTKTEIPRLMVGWRCYHCHQLFHVAPSATYKPPRLVEEED